MPQGRTSSPFNHEAAPMQCHLMCRLGCTLYERCEAPAWHRVYDLQCSVLQLHR